MAKDRSVKREKAIERVDKLRAITVQRGATEHEAATASALADQIGARYGLDRAPEPKPPRSPGPEVARYAMSARTDRRSPDALRFAASG
jgi:hypothetical protein